MRNNRLMTAMTALGVLAGLGACRCDGQVAGEPVTTTDTDRADTGRADSRGADATTTPDTAGAADSAGPDAATETTADAEVVAPPAARLPLVVVNDVALPGGATRFDYQDVDPVLGRLVVAHMNDGAVLFVDLRDGAVLKELTQIPTARGVVVASDVGLTFITSSPNKLVVIDNATLTEARRVTTGRGPDGVGWDPVHQIVGVSDQGDGALSLIASAGTGQRTQVALGNETGNVIFDRPRGWFWITVVPARPPDRLVAVDPTSGKVVRTIDLPGCDGAHGLRLHPDGASAFIACEGNDVLARVALDDNGAGAPAVAAVAIGATGSGPDVLAIDPGLGWLYVAAEGGDLTVFDIDQPGVALVGHDRPGAKSHTVAVEPATHRVFFPLQSGPGGKPVLRIMRPSGLD